MTTTKEQAGLVRTIGERLREARELCNMSQSVAAKRLGYANPSKLSKVERATDTMSVPLWLIAKAAKVYGVSTDYLFGITDSWDGSPLSKSRETNEWLLQTWEKQRARDMETLRVFHARMDAISNNEELTCQSIDTISEALTAFRQLNPGFETDMRGSARLAHAIQRAEEAAGHARAEFRRYRFECVKAAQKTPQLDLD